VAGRAAFTALAARSKHLIKLREMVFLFLAGHIANVRFWHKADMT
jgi:hypothetical protein